MKDAEIFARNLHEIGNMDKRDYENYVALYRVMTEYLRPPDLMIYLLRLRRHAEKADFKKGKDNTNKALNGNIWNSSTGTMSRGSAATNLGGCWSSKATTSTLSTTKKTFTLCKNWCGKS